ncbi:methyltransferase domain-containing protein [Pseudomonadota bacterium]
MTAQIDRLVLGQFIPMHYHFNMLNDTERMQGFKAALEYVVRPGAKVLELGGGTGVLSFFAAQHAAHVYYVEQNPELVETARRVLKQNPNGHKVEIVRADASQYLPPEPVDVVVCEMLHVGLLREKQASMIHNFKKRYLEKFGGPLPAFVPDACFQAVQPVQHDFNYEGFYAPTILFQEPTAMHEGTQGLSDPMAFQTFTYDDVIPQTCCWDGRIQIVADGQLNALRFITKNILAILLEQQRTIDWFNQYLIVPLNEPMYVQAGDEIAVSFDYETGAEFDALTRSLNVRHVTAEVNNTEALKVHVAN